LFYERGAGLDRILAERSFFKNGIVVDPDSRISQLGLLPICPEENYYFFESRCYGGDSKDTLSHLASRWMRETFGVDAKPYIAPRSTKWPGRYVAVSLGVGGNPAKRINGDFERRWLGVISRRGLPIVIDRGAGGEEAERVEQAVQAVPNVNIHKGSFAEFSDVIAQSVAYYGYDSAGTHVAEVCGIPLTAVFKGHVNERMFERWKPTGAGNCRIVRIDEESPDVEQVLRAVEEPK
jgi:ADP-heptose:LPS heptosyltransferase